MKAMAVAVLLALGLGAANADTTPPSRELAMDYLSINGVQQLFEQKTADMSKAITANVVPAQAETIQQGLQSTMSWSSVEDDLIALVQSIYTTEELEAMIEFARSPVAKGMVGKDRRFLSGAKKLAQQRAQLFASKMLPIKAISPGMANLGGTSNGVPVSYTVPPKPVYPEASRLNGEEGTVRLRVLINTQGEAEAVGVIQSSGYRLLDEAALAALARAKFRPYTQNGIAMPVYVPASLTFNLEDDDKTKSPVK